MLEHHDAYLRRFAGGGRWRRWPIRRSFVTRGTLALVRLLRRIRRASRAIGPRFLVLFLFLSPLDPALFAPPRFALACWWRLILCDGRGRSDE
jgi:hypothetical protein